jgi:hypothetical protein
LVDKYLRAVFPDNQAELFGGINVVLIGDIALLPPIYGSPCFAEHHRHLSDNSQKGLQIFRAFQEVYELRQQFWIDSQDAQSSRFQILLHNVRLLALTASDYDLLFSLTLSPTTEKKRFDPLLSTTIMTNFTDVVEFNYHCVTRLHTQQQQPTYVVKYQPGLFLSANVQVMLRTTINRRTGLVSGVIGTVKDIIYEQGTKQPLLIECVIVQFDNYVGPSVSPDNAKCVPVFPIGTFQRAVPRKMLPLHLSYARTVHHCCRQSMNQVFVDLGTGCIASPRTYAALSCARRLSHLQVSNISQEQKHVTANADTRRELITELRRLKSLVIDQRTRLSFHSDEEALFRELQDLTERLDLLRVECVVGAKRTHCDESDDVTNYF